MPRLQNIRSLYDVNRASFDPYVINVMDEKYWKTELSGIMSPTGKTMPLSTVFSNLSMVSGYFPRFASGITSMNMQLATCAIMEAYLDAVQLGNSVPVSGVLGDSSSPISNGIKPALLIPRSYYPVDLDKVWFFGDVHIYGEGAVLITIQWA